MSAGYKPILWNKFKIQYDLILWGGMLLYLASFIGYNIAFIPQQNFNTTLIRAFGTLAILMLHIILFIGPAARLSAKFLPLLYNRRHLGVSMFIIACMHGTLSLLWFHGNGNTNPLLSLFLSNTHYGSLNFFPFQTLGFAALLIIAAMAFTSHDFWLSFLSPKFWKAMHMLVYVAYALVILHVALGIIQFEESPILVSCLFAGLLTLCTLHILTAIKENKKDDEKQTMLNDDWQYVCRVNEIEESRAKMAIIGKERVAVFKYDGKLSAVHNVCKHQMGPLGEGKIIDGCITCPWHGYQYKPEDGCAPPPFKEKLHTYPLQLIDDKIYINVHAQPEGTYIEPVKIPAEIKQEKTNPFFIGWSNANDKKLFKLPSIAAVSFIALALMASLLFARTQQHLTPFQIDYNNAIHLKGWLVNKPVPMLRVLEGKDINGNPVFKNILLVDAFKKGADDIVDEVLKGSNEKYVELSGYISHNVVACGPGSNHTDSCCGMKDECIHGTNEFPLMEIENGRYSFKEMTPPQTDLFISTKDEIIYDTTITGEIIDPKCYFGAMNPGYGQVHQSCAVRCISGGIMPLIKYKLNGRDKYAILVGKKGEPVNNLILDKIGLPVMIKGQLKRMDNWDVVYFEAITEVTLSK